MSIPIGPFGENPLPEPRESGLPFIAYIPQATGTVAHREEKLLHEIHKALDSQPAESELLQNQLKADATYLITGFKKGVKDTIDFLKRGSRYSLNTFREAKTFYCQDSDDFTTNHETKLEPNPDNENEFEIIEVFNSIPDNKEIKSFRAKIQIDPQEDHCGFIKELSVRYEGEELLKCEDDPLMNHEQVHDVSWLLDLSPLNTES